MEGNVLIHSIPVLALFDSGTSHCFVSSRFANLHSLPQYKIRCMWEISAGNGIVTTNRVCKSCPVVVRGRTLEVDMFVLDTRGYDVILGMVWLSRHHAVIDCRSKVVLFKVPNQPEFFIVGESKPSGQEQQGTCVRMTVQE